MSIKGAIFDVDGTLLDSMHIWKNYGTYYLRSQGITPPENINKTINYMTLKQAAQYFCDEFKITKTPDRIADEINAGIEDFYFNKALIKENVPELLKNLKENNVKISIATLTDTYLVEAALRRNGVLDYFSSVFSCSDVGEGKDNPAVYMKAAESIGTTVKNTLIFEDAHYAIATAKKAGFPVIAIYDQWTSATKETISAMSDIYLDSFKDWKEEYLFMKY